MSTDVIFLPGAIAPAAQRYARLFAQLKGVNAIVKDLEVYRADAPPPNYSVAMEVEGVLRAADAAGFTGFHMYGHSGGGAVALAFAMAHPDRVLTLSVDEPASDFTDAGQAEVDWPQFDRILALPAVEQVAAFLKIQVAEGVTLPQRPDGPPPPWMARRPAGMRALVGALRSHHIPLDDYKGLTFPVDYTWGSLTHPRWGLMEQRLSRALPRFTSECFEGLHHLNTCHQAEPERVATRLRALWQSAATGM